MKKTKTKLSVLIAAALSGMILFESSMAYASPKTEQNVSTEEFSSVEDLKEVNEGQVPETYLKEDKDFKFIDGSFTNIKVNNEYDAIKSINSIKDLMKIDYPDSEFEVVQVNDSKYLTSYKLQQMYNSIPLYGREIIVVTDKDGNTTSIGGNYLKDVKIDTNPSIGQVEANSYALKEFEKDAKVSTSELIIYSLNDITPTLCWKVTTSGTKDGKAISMDIFVNASNGEIINEVPVESKAASTGSGKDLTGVNQTFNINKSSSWYGGTSYQLYDTKRKIKIYDASNGRTPGSVVTSSSKNFNDPAAVSALINLGKTYDYYKNNFNRTSYDNKGASIIASVHYKEPYSYSGYDNAYWTSQGSQFVFGDGETYFTPLSGALDVIGHEFTHAVVETTCDLEYQGQSGALNEAFADIIGNFIEGDNDSQWLIGEDIMKNGDAALRSMSNPEQFSQPSKVNGQYYANPNNTSANNDYGGVHTNSGILNHAAYLMWKNGINDKSKLADLFYNSLLIMNSTCNFKQCRVAVLSAAKNINMTSSEIEIIKAAFNAVGITA